MMSIRRRIALWLCPELAPKVRLPFDPADLPVFQGKTTPKWWRNAELRTFLTASHSKLTLEETRTLAIARFGDLVPSRSALQRYWAEAKPLNTSGMMRGEIHFAAGSDYVEVGSNAIQAAVLQMGAPKGSFGTTSRGGAIPWGDIPARPFVGISAEDRTNLPLTMEAWLKSITAGTG